MGGGALALCPVKFDGFVRSLDIPSLKLVVADTSSVGVLEDRDITVEQAESGVDHYRHG